MKKTFLLLFVVQNYLIAQYTSDVAPLQPGNKWVYSITYGFGSNTEISSYEISDSIKTINGIPFHSITSKPFPDITYVALTNDEFFVKYSDEVADSLFKYFKTNPSKGDSWEQIWASDSTVLYNSIVDTITSQVFGQSIIVYAVNRFTIEDGDTVYYRGSREFWTEEFGRIRGLYEQADDYLLGCVIDGVLYGDTTTVGVYDVQLPADLVLYQNYPNPFNPSTIISWQLAVASNVQIKIYDVLGREIKTLVNQYYGPGKYNVTFHAEGLTSGIYFYRIMDDKFSIIKKMIYLK